MAGIARPKISCVNCKETKPHKAFGMCNRCYRRMKQYGDPNHPLQVAGRKKITDICFVSDCETIVHSLGMCVLHYKRKWSTGSTELSLDSRPPLSNRELADLIEAEDWDSAILAIKSQCIIDPQTLCWNGQDVGGNGYARITVGKVRKNMHRLVAQLARGGDSLDGQSVHHKCHNRACCNPEHTQPISQRENTAEMFERKYYLSLIDELNSRIAELEFENELLRTSKASEVLG